MWWLVFVVVGVNAGGCRVLKVCCCCLSRVVWCVMCVVCCSLLLLCAVIIGVDVVCLCVLL